VKAISDQFCSEAKRIETALMAQGKDCSSSAAQGGRRHRRGGGLDPWRR